MFVGAVSLARSCWRLARESRTKGAFASWCANESSWTQSRARVAWKFRQRLGGVKAHFLFFRLSARK
jgi:hypothetical protein